MLVLHIVAGSICTNNEGLPVTACRSCLQLLDKPGHAKPGHARLSCGIALPAAVQSIFTPSRRTSACAQRWASPHVM
jgi:hypothetical protein